MAKEIQSLDKLKRKVYQFIVPGILLALITALISEVINKGFTFEFFADIVFIVVFSIGWSITFFDRWLKVLELLLLALLFTYHILKVIVGITDNVAVGVYQGIDIFFIWTPLIIIYTFIVLKKWTALWTTSVLLAISIVPGVYFYTQLSSYYAAALIQSYVSVAVYIVVLFTAYQLFQVHADMKAMQRQLYLDALTQIGNRCQLENWMEEYLLNAEKPEAFSLIFFDIDHFKQVNDKFGHKVGDDVLIELTRLVDKEMNDGQLFGRWGGEEFLVLLKASRQDATEVAEHLRKIIAGHHFPEVGTVTASFGVTSYEVGDTVNSIFERADRRLYTSKEGGRNRVTG